MGNCVCRLDRERRAVVLAILFVTSAYADCGAEIVVEAAMIVDVMADMTCRRDNDIICCVCDRVTGDDRCTSLSFFLSLSGAA